MLDSRYLSQEDRATLQHPTYCYGLRPINLRVLLLLCPHSLSVNGGGPGSFIVNDPMLSTAPCTMPQEGLHGPQQVAPPRDTTHCIEQAVLCLIFQRACKNGADSRLSSLDVLDSSASFYRIFFPLSRVLDSSTPSS